MALNWASSSRCPACFIIHSHTKNSSSFANNGVSDIVRRSLSTALGELHLGVGTTVAQRHAAGSSDSLMLLLHLAHIGVFNRWAYFRSSQVGTPSRPSPFRGFSWHPFCSTCSTEIMNSLGILCGPCVQSSSCRDVKWELIRCRNELNLLANLPVQPPLTLLIRLCRPGV